MSEILLLPKSTIQFPIISSQFSSTIQNAEYRRIENLIENYLEWCDKLDSYNMVLETQVIDELIDSIQIGDNFEVEIKFKCMDMIAEINEILGE